MCGAPSPAPRFGDQPLVMNAASEPLLAIFGAPGCHARSAIGVNALLPLVELSLHLRYNNYNKERFT